MLAPRYPGRTRRWWQQRGQHPQSRGLSGAVGAEEGDQLPRGDVDVDPLTASTVSFLLTKCLSAVLWIIRTPSRLELRTPYWIRITYTVRR